MGTIPATFIVSRGFRGATLYLTALHQRVLFALFSEHITLDTGSKPALRALREQFTADVCAELNRDTGRVDTTTLLKE